LNGTVRALEVDTVNNILYVGGGFTTAGGIPVRYVAKWDGTSWSAVAPLPTVYSPQKLKLFNGKLFVGLPSTTGTTADSVLLYLDGTGWHPVWGPNEGVFALEVYNGNLYVGGGLSKVDTTIVNCIACYGDSCPGTLIPLTLPYGVNELENNIKFKVFPNPANNNITIETTEDKIFTVRIKNPLGQKVSEKKFRKRIEVDVSSYGKGAFFVEVCDEKGIKCHTQKVILE
jgi:hypothetical protein